MKIAIMQPTYLPWIGFFSLIYHSDAFVFLDDVQFAKRSWQQRNRIYLNKQEFFLTVPVKTKGKRNQLLRDAQVNDDEKWRQTHIKNLQQAYGKSAYYHEIDSLVQDVLLSSETSLSAINIRLIEALCGYLGVARNFVLASSLNCEGSKSTHLLNICVKMGATTYLSALGSKQYIEDEAAFASAGLPVMYQNYCPSPYETQSNSREEFVPYLSAIDLFASNGQSSLSHLMQGSFA